jgi:hypothetical protein
MVAGSSFFTIVSYQGLGLGLAVLSPHPANQRGGAGGDSVTLGRDVSLEFKVRLECI